MNPFLKVTLLLLLFFPAGVLWAQEEDRYVEGKVLGKEDQKSSIPLVGANVYWEGTTIGVTTNTNGKFSIKETEQTNKLIISFVGYQNDTVVITDKRFLTISLDPVVSLKEVEVVHRKKSTEIGYMDPMKTEKIGEEELQKAACCNLSESFETNPSVDVSFTDAVTGTRQIQLLGLAGPYTQITRENIPSVRGLSAIYGLTFIPGPWVESIQLNKGTGSVVNGFESIAGQINVELRKPEKTDRLYLNAYANEGGRLEANANFSHRFQSGKWSTAMLLHANNKSLKRDRNNDGFLDMPLGNHLIGLNRWKYIGPSGLRVQFGVKGTYIDNVGGQSDFQPDADILTGNKWGMHLNMQRLEGWAKIGKVYEAMPWKSMGLQLSGSFHEQNSYFGLNKYDAAQNSFYANYMYQSILTNTNHKFKTGASLQYDDYNEVLNDTVFARTEIVPGGYFEYTYNYFDKIIAVAGIRADYHTIFGPFVTPRAHIRYAITENTVLRASGGRGQRTANILSENNGLLASSRQIIISGNNSNQPYGLDPEVAWNYGFNLTQNFRIAGRSGTFSFDLYRTDFENQIVTDLDQSPQQVAFYNLEGQSFSNSFQTQVDYELIKRLDVRIAYRWYDVKTTYHGELMSKPLVSAHRAFINLGYETPSQWKFDYTLNWQGEKRIPFTGSNPERYQLAEKSPDFFLMNAQISKKWTTRFETYLGAENILNFRQENPILSSEQPFSPYFDSSLVWGPVFGRNVYFGVRYRI